MRSRAPWGQMVVATVVVMVLPAVIVGVLSALGVISALWAGVLLAVALSLALTSAGSAYWRRHATGDVLFSDLLLWGWLRRGRMERRLGRADDLLRRAGTMDAEGKADLLHDLGVALDAQDPYLDGHSRRVARYATMTASRLDVPAEQAERVRTAALIHDIGKLHVPQAIVSKAGRLTDDEFDLMKLHAGEGGAMVECLGDPSLAAAVRSHHERWDGSGYPDGLAGERIPPEARIISVVDTFDAIISARSYRPATPHAKALKIIEEEAGQQLDPDAARAFISCYTDRRGAALWAGIASVPRQLAERLAITPGEIAGVLAAALTAPLVLVAGAMAAEALPVTSDPPALSRQAASTPAATATPGAQSTPTPSARAPRAEGGTAGAEATSTPSSGRGSGRSPDLADGPSGPREPAASQESETSTPRAGASGRTVPPLPGTPTPEPEDPLLPSLLPPPFPTSTPEPTPPSLPTATATPSPTPSPEPSPGPVPTPEPLPPLFPSTLPVFPESTPTPPSHSKDDCKNGGWMDLGYPNQGQCIADAHHRGRRQ